MKPKILILLTLLSCLLILLYFLRCDNSTQVVTSIKAGVKHLENAVSQDTLDWQKFGIQLTPPEKSYVETRRFVAAEKAALSTANPDVSGQTLADAGKRFEELLLNQRIPHWYGTKWDFYGHTETPRQGEIACGYFVSTTLKHIGLNLDRYKLAQQAPENEAKSLSLGSPVIEIRGEEMDEKLAAIKQAIQPGICFVGLGSSHVGYLLFRQDELFFIHASYFSPDEVVAQRAGESSIFSAFNHYYLVELSNNAAFIEHWLSGEQVQVKMN
ncbi:MAG: hypothetical protein AAB316_00215 [Bacteroidota bacterium]